MGLGSSPFARRYWGNPLCSSRYQDVSGPAVPFRLAPDARACPARVAPFGHLRIPGRQRLPGAFRRVAASFLGRQRLGIPRAPFVRKPHAIQSLRPKSIHGASARTGSRHEDEPFRSLSDAPPRTASRIAPDARWLDAPLPLALIYRQEPRRGLPCSKQAHPRPHRISQLHFACSARGRPDTSTGSITLPGNDIQARPSPRLSPTAARPGGPRVAHCQGATGMPIRPRQHAGECPPVGPTAA